MLVLRHTFQNEGAAGAAPSRIWIQPLMSLLYHETAGYTYNKSTDNCKRIDHGVRAYWAPLHFGGRNILGVRELGQCTHISGSSKADRGPLSCGEAKQILEYSSDIADRDVELLQPAAAGWWHV